MLLKKARWFAGSTFAAVVLGTTLTSPITVQAQTKYVITLTDLTSTAPNSGQPFSPPVFATHDNSVNLWKLGQTASVGVQHIAEEGNRTFMVNALQPLVGSSILDLVTPLSAPLPQGQSVTLSIIADAAHPFLSDVWMLGWTNDGFSGQDSIDLSQIHGPTVFDLIGYDAGTEINNEATGFLGALGGGNARDPENGVITVHPGILGIADAPTSWNWANPVARLVITAAPEPATLGLLLLGLPAGLLARRRRA